MSERNLFDMDYEVMMENADGSSGNTEIIRRCESPEEAVAAVRRYMLPDGWIITGQKPHEPILEDPRKYTMHDGVPVVDVAGSEEG